MWSYITNKIENYYSQNCAPESLNTDIISTNECVQRLDAITRLDRDKHTIDSYGRVVVRDDEIKALFRRIFGCFFPVDKSAEMRLREGTNSIQKMVNKIEESALFSLEQDRMCNTVIEKVRDLVSFELKEKSDIDSACFLKKNTSSWNAEPLQQDSISQRGELSTTTSIEFEKNTSESKPLTKASLPEEEIEHSVSLHDHTISSLTIEKYADSSTAQPANIERDRENIHSDIGGIEDKYEEKEAVDNEEIQREFKEEEEIHQHRRRSIVEVETPAAFYALRLRDGKYLISDQVEQNSMITRSGLIIPAPVIREIEE